MIAADTSHKLIKADVAEEIMKIKKLAVGFIVAGFFMALSATVVLTPTGTASIAQICEVSPNQCVMPQNFSAAYFPLQNW